MLKIGEQRMRTPRWRKKRCPATMLHHLTAILTFFARETTLADVNNIAISLSLSLFSDRSSPPSLWYRVPFPSGLSEIAGHSIYISVLFADKRVSMATISSGRMEPIVFLLAPPISRLFFSPSFPLLPTFCSSSVLRRSWSRSSPFLRRDPVDWSGGRPQLWRRVEENTPRIKTGCIHDCMLHSSADPRGDRTFAPYVSARKRKLRRAKRRDTNP